MGACLWLPLVFGFALAVSAFVPILRGVMFGTAFGMAAYLLFGLMFGDTVGLVMAVLVGLVVLFNQRRIQIHRTSWDTVTSYTNRSMRDKASRTPRPPTSVEIITPDDWDKR